MPICLYDNPSTMRREAWQDGVLLSFVSFELFFLKTPTFAIPVIDFRLQGGPWEEGKFHHGGREAMVLPDDLPDPG